MESTRTLCIRWGSLSHFTGQTEVTREFSAQGESAHFQSKPCASPCSEHELECLSLGASMNWMNEIDNPWSEDEVVDSVPLLGVSMRFGSEGVQHAMVFSFGVHVCSMQWSNWGG